MRHLTLLVVVGLLAGACGDSAATTTTVAVPQATIATTQPPATSEPPATTQATTTTTVEVAPTLTFTGSECIYSGPDTFSSGELVRFTVRNESSVLLVVVVLELLGSTLEDLVADDVRILPLIESWPPSAPEPKEAHSFRTFDPGTETPGYAVLFTRAGDYGTACWPIDGNPAIQGAPLTVEE